MFIRDFLIKNEDLAFYDFAQNKEEIYKLKNVKQFLIQDNNDLYELNGEKKIAWSDILCK